MEEFKKYNRIFISNECENHKFPYKNQKLVLLYCNGMYQDLPTYEEYSITFIKYNDGSNNKLLTVSQNYDVTDILIKHFEENYTEIHISYESTFWLMYKNIGIINLMTDTIKREFNHLI